jgi:hypothetical protein
MAKHSSKASSADAKPRSSPYTKPAKGGKSGKSSKASSSGVSTSKKARVEVRYEGAASAASKRSVSAREAVDVKEEPEDAVVVDVNGKGNGKGKSRALSSTGEQQADQTVQVSPGSFIAIAGSYEKLLYGIEGTYPTAGASASASASASTSKTDEPQRPDVQPVFIFPAHLAYVKCIAASPGGKWLATGSEDEFIKVWDLRRRKEVGSLSQHSGMSIHHLWVYWRGGSDQASRAEMRQEGHLAL